MKSSLPRETYPLFNWGLWQWGQTEFFQKLIVLGCCLLNRLVDCDQFRVCRRQVDLLFRFRRADVPGNVEAEVVRVHRPTQRIGDAPEGFAELFLVEVGQGSVC